VVRFGGRRHDPLIPGWSAAEQLRAAKLLDDAPDDDTPNDAS
jgi:hypothetical protein